MSLNHAVRYQCSSVFPQALLTSTFLILCLLQFAWLLSRNCVPGSTLGRDVPLQGSIRPPLGQWMPMPDAWGITGSVVTTKSCKHSIRSSNLLSWLSKTACSSANSFWSSFYLVDNGAMVHLKFCTHTFQLPHHLDTVCCSPLGQGLFFFQSGNLDLQTSDVTLHHSSMASNIHSSWCQQTCHTNWMDDNPSWLLHGSKDHCSCSEWFVFIYLYDSYRLPLQDSDQSISTNTTDLACTLAVNNLTKWALQRSSGSNNWIQINWSMHI